MYTTIEADIKNGRINSAEAKIPAEAHVLITFISEKQASRPDSGITGSLRGVLKQYANPHLLKHEKAAWGQAAECKHEAD